MHSFVVNEKVLGVVTSSFLARPKVLNVQNHFSRDDMKFTGIINFEIYGGSLSIPYFFL